jgi:hypothetical protein
MFLHFLHPMPAGLQGQSGTNKEVATGTAFDEGLGGQPFPEEDAIRPASPTPFQTTTDQVSSSEPKRPLIGMPGVDTHHGTMRMIRRVGQQRDGDQQTDDFRRLMNVN